MAQVNSRNCKRLHSRKVILWVLLCGISLWALPSGQAQRSKEVRLQNYDSYFLHYGMSISAHVSRYALDYSSLYTTAEFDTLQAIHVRNSPGFKVGFILNARLLDNLSVRLLPSVGFYENRLNYQNTNGDVIEQLNDYTLLELPLLLKYRSKRFFNTAIYLVGGFTPSIEAKIRKEEVSENRNIRTTNFFVAAEIGVGLDLYMAFFKLSPEIRYSVALSNVLSDEPNNPYHRPIDSLLPHYFAFYLHFEGGAY